MIRFFLVCFMSFSSFSLPAAPHVLALCGSTREASLNKQLLSEAVADLEAQGAVVTVFDLKKLPIPFYEGDLEEKEGMPSNAKLLRSLMLKSDLVLIATPEYNGSLPPLLKNAIDWASRSEEGGGSREAFEKARFVLISASPGSLGGSRAVAHLKAILANVKASVYEADLSLPRAHEELGKKEAPYREKLKDLMTSALKK